MKKILNLGCGKGQNIPQIIHGSDLVCVDIDQDSLNEAKLKYPQCQFINSRAEDLEFPEDSFDEIYCFDILEHVDNLDAVMLKIKNLLKPGGVLYVEVPYDRSENMLLRVNPMYFKQIGHQRVFEYSQIDRIFNDYGFDVVKKRKSRGIVNIYLWTLFKLGIGLDDQMSSVKGRDRWIERFLFLITIWFDKNLFNTFLKWIPLWIITLPIGALISLIYPKTIALTLQEK